jgi:hypothetical protein
MDCYNSYHLYNSSEKCPKSRGLHCLRSASHTSDAVHVSAPSESGNFSGLVAMRIVSYPAGATGTRLKIKVLLGCFEVRSQPSGTPVHISKNAAILVWALK